MWWVSISNNDHRVLSRHAKYWILMLYRGRPHGKQSWGWAGKKWSVPDRRDLDLTDWSKGTELTWSLSHLSSPNRRTSGKTMIWHRACTNAMRKLQTKSPFIWLYLRWLESAENTECKISDYLQITVRWRSTRFLAVARKKSKFLECFSPMRIKNRKEASFHFRWHLSIVLKFRELATYQF